MTLGEFIEQLRAFPADMEIEFVGLYDITEEPPIIEAVEYANGSKLLQIKFELGD